MKLNLVAEDNVSKIILDYLEQNVSEELANKINNGIEIEKEGKKLINKKTLKGFWEYATKEAQKLAKKGATYGVQTHDVVFGWAIHYFEEESIVEELYNLDGSKYEQPKPKITPKKATVAVAQTNTIPVIPKTKQEQAGQESLFAMFDNPQETPVVQKTVEKPKQVVTEKPKGNPLYEKYMDVQNRYPDYTVVMRVGDFYEVFGEKAKVIAEKLDLTLTGRECGLTERIPMIGFPYHASDIYFNKLVEFTRIAIIEGDVIKQRELNLKVENKQPKQNTTKTATLFDKYKELIDSYPNFIIAYENKAFYEVYGKSAVALSEMIGFTLLQKDMENGTQLPCIKFFTDMKDHYAEKITKQYNIAFGNSPNNMSFYEVK